jgi:hypothetical protein
VRTRRLSGLDGPSASALFQHSFPQPEDASPVDDDNELVPPGESNGVATASSANGDAAAPSTNGAASGPSIRVPGPSDDKSAVTAGDDESVFVDAPSEPDEDMRADSDEETPEFDPSRPLTTRRRSSTRSFQTASSQVTDVHTDEDPERDLDLDKNQQPQHQDQASSLQVPTGQEEGASQKAQGARPASTAESSNGAASMSATGEPSVDVVSTTSLLRKADVNKAQAQPDVDSKPPSRGILARAKSKRKSQLDTSEDSPPITGVRRTVTRTKSNLRNLVKFELPEDSKRAELHLKAKAAQMTLQRASTRLWRQKMQDGLVVKMERMLVRVDEAGKEVPEDFDENGSQKIDSRVKDKWREYMVVCRQSISDEADFVLQMYKTRVSTYYVPPNMPLMAVK